MNFKSYNIKKNLTLICTGCPWGLQPLLVVGPHGQPYEVLIGQGDQAPRPLVPPLERIKKLRDLKNGHYDIVQGHLVFAAQRDEVLSKHSTEPEAHLDEAPA